MKRRSFLGLSAQVLGVLSVVGPTGACATLRTVGPWTGPPPSMNDPRMRVLSYATLAGNAHNTQAWLLRLPAPDEVELYVDPNRLLPETDPPSRQIHLSQGTFLETLALGAQLEGLRASIELFPRGDDPEQPVARVRLEALPTGSAVDPLAHQITRRRTNKAPYHPGVAVPLVHRQALERVAAGSGFTVRMYDDPSLRPKLVELCTEAMAIEVSDRKRNAETAHWFRLSASEVEEKRDGLSLAQVGVVGFEKWFAETFLLDREGMADPDGAFAAGAVDATEDQAASASGFVALVTPSNQRRDQVRAGRLYARLQLTATSFNMDMHPLSQALEEYADMKAHYSRIKQLLGVADAHTIQMFLRVGYGDHVIHTSRRSVDDLIVSA